MLDGYSGTVIAVCPFAGVCLRSAGWNWVRSDTNLNATGTNPDSLSDPPCTIGNVTDTPISDVGVTLPLQLSKYSDYFNDTFLSQRTDTQVQSSKAHMQMMVVYIVCTVQRSTFAQ